MGFERKGGFGVFGERDWVFVLVLVLLLGRLPWRR